MLMAKKLTEKALIKKLDGMNQEELKRIIVDLYKCNKSVEEGMSLLLLGEDYGSILLEKSVTILFAKKKYRLRKNLKYCWIHNIITTTRNRKVHVKTAVHTK